MKIERKRVKNGAETATIKRNELKTSGEMQLAKWKTNDFWRQQNETRQES